MSSWKQGLCSTQGLTQLTNTLSQGRERTSTQNLRENLSTEPGNIHAVKNTIYLLESQRFLTINEIT